MALSIRKYKKNECITFKSTKGKYGALSNMAPDFPVSLNGINIKNVEVLYQAFRFPDNPEIQREIFKYASPISAKKYGRTLIHHSRNDWERHRFKIMKFCIGLKLHQNREKFTKVLLSTGNLPIVEYTDKDKVWGAIPEDDYYIGTNALGRLLMELREQVKNNTFEFNIPQLNNSMILAKPIDEYSFKDFNNENL
jgi:ribA/ribD-fused uncharacterized protein